MKRLKPRRVRGIRTFAAFLTAVISAAAGHAETADAADHSCGDQERWDAAMSMCMPLANSNQAQILLSGQFNAFGVFSVLQGPRGVDQFAAPNMFMVAAGKTLAPHHFVNLEFMGTTELWTYPDRGYPELLQIGEERSDGSPYLDAQHPHSSPIMGLTLSDTIGLGSSNSLRLSFAPRGQSTDGPIPYMHRESARDNPDAPLGHHVGQDVGHISSTVLGLQLDLGSFIIESSAFNGSEPNPTKVDLPLGALNSAALRATYVLAPAHRVMGSIAHVEQIDAQYPGTTSALRLSASLYDRFALEGAGTVDHTFLIGSITRHPAGPALMSFLDEAVLERRALDYWGRIEVLQRLRSELQVADSASGPTDEKRWVSALTVGYTHWTGARGAIRVGFGGSLTVDYLPEIWSAYYGGRTPVTFRLIVQIRGSGQRHIDVSRSSTP
jgi:hypothetical protein